MSIRRFPSEPLIELNHTNLVNQRFRLRAGYVREGGGDDRNEIDLITDDMGLILI